MTPSVEAHPTQEPVFNWSPIAHQAARKSMLGGGAPIGDIAPPSTASSNVQSLCVSLEGTRLQIRCVVLMMGLLFALILRALFAMIDAPAVSCEGSLLVPALTMIVALDC